MSRKYNSRSPSYRASGERHGDRPNGYERRHSGQSWQQTRQKALQRADGACMDCGNSTDALHVHHEQPVTEFGHPEAAHRQNNVVAICGDCHDRRENGGTPR